MCKFGNYITNGIVTSTNGPIFELPSVRVVLITRKFICIFTSTDWLPQICEDKNQSHQ